MPHERRHDSFRWRFEEKRINEGQVGIVGGWIGTGTAPGGGNSSLFTCSLSSKMMAAAPISRIHSGRIGAICCRHGSIKEMSGWELIRLLLPWKGTRLTHIARRELE